MRCHYCGNEIAKDINVCPYCDKPKLDIKPGDRMSGGLNDAVFSLEEWHKKKVKDRHDKVLSEQDELERRVEEKKRKLDHQRKNTGLDGVGMVSRDPADLDTPDGGSILSESELKELIKILATDKKKEIRAARKREKEAKLF